MRATLAPVIARNPYLKYLKVSAKVADDHGAIVCKEFRADVLHETAAAHEVAAHDPEVC